MDDIFDELRFLLKTSISFKNIFFLFQFLVMVSTILAFLIGFFVAIALDKTGKHLCWSLFLNKVATFRKVFQNSFFCRTNQDKNVKYLENEKSF